LEGGDATGLDLLSIACIRGRCSRSLLAPAIIALNAVGMEVDHPSSVIGVVLT
jgi:hypothetical protein